MKTQPSIPHRRLTLVLWAALLCLTNPGLAVPLDQATLALQEIAKTAYPGLKPEQVVARMIADGSNPILSAKAVAQIAPPEAAPSIAAGAASVVPEAAADIAAAVAQVVPDQAVAIAVAVGKVVPAMAPQIAATVAQVVPNLAAQIAQAMGSAVPQAAGAVSTAVAGAVPGVSGLAATVSTIGVGTVAAGAVGAAAVGAVGITKNNQSGDGNSVECVKDQEVSRKTIGEEIYDQIILTIRCIGESLRALIGAKKKIIYRIEYKPCIEGKYKGVEAKIEVGTPFSFTYESDVPPACTPPKIPVGCNCICPPRESPYKNPDTCE